MRPALPALTLILALILALFLALILPPSAARAQSSAAGLRAMLDLVPALPPDQRVELHFADLAAARGLSVAGIAGASADPVLTQIRALEHSALAQHLRNPATDWRGTVGFGPAQIDRALTLAAPPMSSTLLVLRPGAGAAVGPALAASGYVETRQDGLTAWARGETDFQIDIRARNPDDPFGAGMGRSARVQVLGDLIRHAAGWPVLIALAGAQDAPFAATPDAVALLAALDGMTEAGELVAATILTDAGWLGLSDPALLLQGAPLASGQPTAWRMALIADFADGATATGVLALTLSLPDTALAEPLRHHVADGWAVRPLPSAGRSMADLVGAPAIVTLNPVKSGLWVLLIRASAPTGTIGPGIPRNPVTRRLHDATMRRDLVFLQP